MLDVLLASRGVRAPRSVAGATISIAVHAALVVAVVLTGRKVVREIDSGLEQALRFLLPTDRTSTSSERMHLVRIGGEGESEVGKVKGVKQLGDRPVPESAELKGPPTDPDRSSNPVAPPESTDNAWSVLDVDSAAVRDPASAAPAYPKTLMEKGVEGHATMRFVVDSTGLIDLETVLLLEATHPEFVSSVREAMPRMLFRPAKVGVHPVRQLAEQMFRFEIRKMVSSETVPLPKKP